MPSSVYVTITGGGYNYDHLSISDDKIRKSWGDGDIALTCNCGKAKVDSVIFSLLMREVEQCDGCRRNFVSSMTELTRSKRINWVKFYLEQSDIDTIDYNWNGKLGILVRERCELDHALSWLSTLGGAFSALGDYFPSMAETAGRISIHQFQLAMRLGDDAVVSRCILYYSLSLIQRRHYKEARRIILDEYRKAHRTIVRDHRLIKMCQGIWSKLQYEKKQNRR